MSLFVLTSSPTRLVAKGIPGPPLPYTGTAVSPSLRSLEQNAFESGEMLQLRVTYLGLTAGYIIINVKRETIEGRDLHQLNMTARTVGPISWFYSVHYQFVSYMDAEGLFSWGYNFSKDDGDEIEQDRIRYHHQREFFTENGTREGEVPQYTQDLLSAFYFLRMQDLGVGDKYQYPIHSGDNYYRLTIEVRENNRVATGDGWRAAYQLVPKLERSTGDDEAFEYVNEFEGVRLWLSQDKHKVPLKISFPATFGQLYGYLQSYESG